VLLGLDEVSVDRLFAQRLARFEPVQTVYQDEAITIAPNQDWGLLPDIQHTLRDLLDDFWFERCSAFYRHVDVRDRKFFSLIMVLVRFPCSRRGLAPYAQRNDMGV
jgi:hypothetical protein